MHADVLAHLSCGMHRIVQYGQTCNEVCQHTVTALRRDVRFSDSVVNHTSQDVQVSILFQPLIFHNVSMTKNYANAVNWQQTVSGSL